MKDYYLYADMDGVVTCVAQGTGAQVASDSFVIALSDMSVKADKGRIHKQQRYRKSGQMLCQVQR